MTAVIYARYSSDKQTFASIDAQVRACREYAENKGLEVLRVYADEAISGKTTNRQQYQRMIRAASRHEFDVILIHQYDRIARNLADHVNLEVKLKGYEVDLVAVNQDFGNTKESKIIKPILWALSEYYIDNLSVEVKKGHRETALKALHNGGYPPFGYDIVDQRYVINKREALYVQKMFSSAINREIRSLIDEMASIGIVGKRGKPIKYPQIYEILRNPKYTGDYIYCTTYGKTREEQRNKENAIVIEGAIPAIVSKETFEQVQEILKSRKHTGRNKGKYLCSGLVYCGNCGAKLHASTTHRKGHVYHIYTCSKKCGFGSFRVEDIDDAARNYLKLYLSDSNAEALTLLVKRYLSAERSLIADFNKNIESQIESKNREYDNLMKAIASNTMPNEVLSSIGVQMKNILSEIDMLKKEKPPRDFTGDQIMAWFRSVREAPDDKVMQIFLDSIIIQKNPTAITINSRLQEVVGNNGCGGTLAMIPTILLKKTFSLE